MGVNMENAIDTISRISIFQALTVGQLTEINTQKFECLLGEHYHEFITLCEFVKQRNDIESFSCDVESGSMIFKILLVNGETETI